MANVNMGFLKGLQVVTHARHYYMRLYVKQGFKRSFLYGMVGMKKSILLILVLVFFHSAAVQAESLKNSDFLKSSEAQRHWWYSGAFTVLGHVAFLEDEEKGKCVWNWLFSDYEKKEALLMKSFKMYPDSTPSGIVIALLRRDCGAFQKNE